MPYPASLYASTALSPELTAALLVLSIAMLVAGLLLVRKKPSSLNHAPYTRAEPLRPNAQEAL